MKRKAFFYIISILITINFNYLPGFENNKEIKLIRKSAFGDPISKDLNYSFSDPIAISSDSKGNLFVLEAGNHKIKIFTKDFKYVKSFGSKGSGPGEFRRPESLEIDANDNIYVGDPGKGVIEVFNSKLEYKKSIKMKSTNIQFKLLKDGKIVLRNPNLDGGRGLKENNVPLFLILDNDGKEIKKIGQGIYFKKPPFNTGGNRMIITVDKNNYIYAAFLFQNKIEIYSYDNKLVKSIKREVNKNKSIDKSLNLYSTITNGLDVDFKSRIWSIKQKRPTKKSEEIATYVTVSSNNEMEKNIQYDRTVNTTDLFELEVFDKGGNLVKTFKLDHFCDDLKIIGNKIFILDAIREMKFYVYEINN